MATAELQIDADPAEQMAKAIDDYLEYLSGGSVGLSHDAHQAIRRERLAAIRRARAAYKMASGN